MPAPRSFKVPSWSLFFSAINRMTVQLKSVQMSSSDQSTDQMSDPSSGGDSPEGPEDGPAQFLFGERFESSANILLEWKPLLRAFKVWNYFCLWMKSWSKMFVRVSSFKWNLKAAQSFNLKYKTVNSNNYDLFFFNENQSHWCIYCKGTQIIVLNGLKTSLNIDCCSTISGALST